MKKTTFKKLLAVLMSAIMMTVMIPYQAFAEQCAWTLYVNGSAYSSSASYATSGQLTFSSNKVTLNGFSGNTIQAIPGGAYGDDDAPVLNIVLKSTSTLTGGIVDDGSLGCIYAEERQGGNGEDSIVNISGTGTLNLQLDPGTEAEAPAINKNVNAIKAGTYNQTAGNVNINTYTYTSTNPCYAIDADANVSGTAKLIVNSTATRGFLKLNGKKSYLGRSSCTAAGVHGNLAVSTSKYVSITTSNAYNDGLDTATTGTATIPSSATSALYIKSSDNIEKYSYTSSAHRLAYIENETDEGDFVKTYVAITPKTTNYNLSRVNASNLMDSFSFPKVGDDKIFDDEFQSNAECFFTIRSYNVTSSGSFDKYETGNKYSFTINVVPKPGYYFNNGTDSFTAENIKTFCEYEPTSVSLNEKNSYFSVVYDYSLPSFIKNNTTENYCVDSTGALSVETDSTGYVYKWVMDVWIDGGVYQGLTIPWGDMDGFDGSDTDTFTLGSIDEDMWNTTAPNGIYSDEIDQIDVYCVVSSIAGEVSSAKTRWEPFNHIYAVKTPAVAPTCTEQGSKAVLECSACAKVIGGDAVVANGHTPQAVPAVDASCKAPGVTAGEICSVCGEVVSGCTEIPVNDNHKMINVPAVAPTCTAPGVTAGQVCMVCGKSTVKVVPAKGHSFGTNNKTCSVCGEANPNYKAPTQAQLEASVATQYNVSKDTMALNDSKITTAKGDSDFKGSSFGKLKLKQTKNSKTSNTIAWSKVSGADGYIVYAAKCGSKLKKVKTTTGTSYTQNKLKKGTYYKYVVSAYKNVNGKKVTLAASKTIHVTTQGGKYGNAKAVKTNAKKDKVSVKKGKTFAIKASNVKKDKAIKKHTAIRYESSNTKIATVSSKGVITGKKKGKCKVYVYSQNGVAKTLTVTVK